MLILSKCYKKLKRFNSFTFKDKLFLVKAFLVTGIFRMAMLYIPFSRLKNYMGKSNVESKNSIVKEEYYEAIRIAWAVNLASKYTPWESKCLVRALTAQYFLYKKNISSTLYLGVSKERILNSRDSVVKNSRESEELIAHSWIRCGDVFVTGGNGEHYAVVAKFYK